MTLQLCHTQPVPLYSAINCFYVASLTRVFSSRFVLVIQMTAVREA
jgi:hypothetical protein